MFILFFLSNEPFETGEFQEAVLSGFCSPPYVVSLAGGRLHCDEGDVAAADAEIVQLTGVKAAKFGNCVAVAAPVIVCADDVHFGFPLGSKLSRPTVTVDDKVRQMPQFLQGQIMHGSLAICAMHN
jgi:hypothetical protein